MIAPQSMPPPSLPWAASAVVRGLQVAMGTVGRVAPEAAASWCHGRYFTPARPPVSRAEKHVLAGATPLSIPYESPGNTPYPGGPLRAHAWGAGETVLLVHGWETRGAWLARAYVAPLVAKGLRVVAIDMPGHGDSPGVQSDLGAFVAALLAAESALGPLRAVLAHSIGAAATLVALSRGLAAERAVCLAPVCWLRTLPERFSQTLRLPGPVHQAFWTRLCRTFPAADWDALSGDVVAAKLTLPGLVVQDGDDKDVHPSGAEAIVRAWPGAELVATRGLGHRRVVADPEVVRRAVAFITG